MAKPAPIAVSVERIIDAPPEVLYDLISDVTRMGEWSPETTDAEWIKGATGPEVGATFVGSNELGKSKWKTKPVVTEADPGRRFAFDVPHKFGATWRYETRPM